MIVPVRLTEAQAAVLRVLAAGRARIGRRTVAEPSGARCVSQAVWAFTHGQHRRAALVTASRQDGEEWASLTSAGKTVVDYFERQVS